MGDQTRTASCSCGALRAEMRGEPVQINMCACFACQRRSGAAFSYTAFFPEADVSIEGERRIWRRATHSGGTHDAYFCPVCASTVMTRLSAIPGLAGIAVGCFADPSFAPPTTFFWSSLHHQWFATGDAIVHAETQ